MDYKECTNCENELTVTSFHRRGNGYQSWCKECRRKKDQQYHLDNREKRSEQKKVWKRHFSEWYMSLKNGLCADCGESFHPVCMQWDHLPEFTKTSNLSDLYGKKNKKMILEEIQKCELVCSNCHALRTYHRGLVSG